MGRPRRKTPRAKAACVATTFKDGKIFCSDAAELLGQLRPNSVDVIFLDPPVNSGKKYGRRSTNADQIGEHEYAAYIDLVLARAVTALRSGGTLFLYHLPR